MAAFADVVAAVRAAVTAHERNDFAAIYSCCPGGASVWVPRRAKQPRRERFPCCRRSEPSTVDRWPAPDRSIDGEERLIGFWEVNVAASRRRIMHIGHDVRQCVAASGPRGGTIRSIEQN